MYEKNRGRPAKFINISNDLKNYIRINQLTDGTALPSERKLAKLFDAVNNYLQCF